MIRRAGPDRWTLRVGGLGIELRGLEPPLRSAVLDRYAPFLDEEPGDIALEFCTLDPEADLPPDDPSGYEPVIRLAAGQLTMVSPAWTALYDLERRRGVIATHPEPTAAPFFVENALRQIVQVELVSRQAILVHAAGVIEPAGDRAFVFAGRSGAGKSTISGLLATVGGHVLSDDIVLLGAGSRRPVLAATPFFGTMPPDRPAPRTAPIAGVHLLEQAADPEAIRIDDAACAVAHLVSNVPFTGCFDPVRRERLVELLVRTVRVVPVSRLRFRRDLSFLPSLGWRSTEVTR